MPKLLLKLSAMALVIQIQAPAFATDLTPQQASQVNLLIEESRLAILSDDPHKALEKLKVAKEIAPDSAVVLVNYGFALGRTGQYLEAIDSLKRAIKLDPKLPQAWIDLASLYQSTGQFPLAIETFNQYLSRFPMIRQRLMPEQS